MWFYILTKDNFLKKINNLSVVDVPRFLNITKLNSEQKNVLEAVRSGQNIFFTGSAGTGKSYLLKYIVGLLAPEVTFITASTGIAACHIGGTTLHSFAGIGNGTADVEQCISLALKRASQQWRQCKHLIIDEISMVNGDYFQKLEAVARAVRNNDKPFGGIQLILCGDFFQLPPVTKKGEKKKFCFQSSAWLSCIDITLELTNVRRQDDLEFINILQSIRMGRCTEEMSSRLKNTIENDVNVGDIKATRLCTHKEDVVLINGEHLKKLRGELKTYFCTDSDSNFADLLNCHTPVDEVLTLKTGCQVMLMKNLDISKGLINGARGVVLCFSSSGLPIVKFVAGVETEINYAVWNVKGNMGMNFTRRQLPLKLAWAFSIHKSQGMTLDCVEMSLSKVFESGQAYVALSRAKNLKGLRVLDFRSSCVRAHTDVLKFYKESVNSEDRNLLKRILYTKM